MPLIKSGSRAAITTNIKEMVASGHPQRQAVAAAMRTADRYAGGGNVPMAGGPGRFDALERIGKGYQPPPSPKPAEKAGGGSVSGFLHSAVPGRTDRLPITVGGGAYILPADHLAAIGQGNSNAGADIVNKMFAKKGPYGTTLAGGKAASPHLPKIAPMRHLAEGGDVGKPTPIIAAGGEYTLSPEQIIGRFGDLNQGHKALDKWVLDTRAQHIKTLRGLKPPKKD